MVWFKGSLSTGELIFAPYKFIKPFYSISYDRKENKAKVVAVEGIGDHILLLVKSISIM